MAAAGKTENLSATNVTRVMVNLLTVLRDEARRLIRESGLVEIGTQRLAILQCNICRLRGQQRYRVDFSPYSYGGFCLPREAQYVCHRCVAKYKSDPQVIGITVNASRFRES